MILLLSCITGMLALLFLVVAWNMGAGPFLRDAPATDEEKLPSISVLIPARNEERNIATLLHLLRVQDYPRFSIIVLDDHSTDNTAGIVRDCAMQDERITLLQGEALPEGWTGKNWACHQLSAQADGDILLFVDADVHPDAKALRRTASWMQGLAADALSSFPRQLVGDRAAALIVPMMDVILYAFLPLSLVWRTRTSSLAAANGQWFAFRRNAYERIGGHAAVRDVVVEDIALAKRVKRAGGRMLLTAGNGSVACEMYHGFAEIREGFSKNFFAAFQFRPVPFVLYLLLLLLLFVLPYVMLATSWWMAALPAVLLNLGFRLLLSWRAGHRISSALLHPFGTLATVAIGIDAMRRVRRGAVQWKGRDIAVGPK